MYGLLGAIGLSLSVDKRNYQVGDQITYSLTGGIPGSQIAWTSYQNGKPTGEYQANYGQTIDANGTAQFTVGPWTDANVGSWQKEAIVIGPDGSISNAEVSFSVSPKAPTPVAGSGSPASSDFFSGSVTLPVVGTVSKPVAIGGGLLLALFLFSGKRGR